MTQIVKELFQSIQSVMEHCSRREADCMKSSAIGDLRSNICKGDSDGCALAHNIVKIVDAIGKKRWPDWNSYLTN